MPEFARGNLLGRESIASSTPVTLYTATLNTEITMIAIAITGSGTGNPILSLFHDDEGVLYDSTTAIAWEVPISKSSPVEAWASNGAGSGIHVKPGGSIGVGADLPCTVSVYGIIKSLSPIL